MVNPVISLGFDTSKGMNELVKNINKDVQVINQKLNNQRVEIKLKGNTKDLQDTLLQIHKIKPGNLEIHIDDSNIMQKVKNIESLMTKEGKISGNKFAEAINKGLQGINIQAILDREWKKAGAKSNNLNPTNLKAILPNLRGYADIKNITFDPGDTDFIYRKIEALMELGAVLKNTGSFDTKQFNSLAKNFNEAFGNINFSPVVEKVKSQTNSITESVRTWLLDIQKITNSGTDLSEKSITDKLNQLRMSKNELKKSYDKSADDPKTEKNFINKFQGFIKAGGDISELDKNILQFYKDLSVEKKAPSIEKLKETAGVTSIKMTELESILERISHNNLQNRIAQMSSASERLNSSLERTNTLSSSTITGNKTNGTNSNNSKISSSANAQTDINSLSAETSEVNKIEQSVNSLKNAFRSKTEAIAQEENQMRQSASKEVQSLQAIKNAAVEVQNAVKNMVKSLSSSEQNIRQSIGKEVNSFNAIVEKAKTLSNELNSIANIRIPEIKIGSIKSDNTANIKNSVTREMNSIIKAAEKSSEINSLAASLNDVATALMVINDCVNIPNIFKGINAHKNAGTNLQNVAAALDKIKISLNGLSSVGSDFLKGISDIVSETESLRNLASILRESTSRIREARSSTAQNNNPESFQNRAFQMLNDFQSKFSLTRVSAEFEGLKRSISGITNENGLNRFINQMASLKNKADSFSNIDKAINKTKEKLNRFNIADGTRLSDEFSSMKVQVNSLNEDLRRGSSDIETYNNEVSRLLNSFGRRVKLGNGELIDTSNVRNFEDAKKAALSYADSVGKVKKVLSHSETPDGNNFYKMTIRVREASGEVKNLSFIYDDTLKKMSVSSKNLGNEASNFGKAVDTIKAKIGQLVTYWTAMYLNPYQLVNVIRTTVHTITELDTALIDLQKTAKMSSSELNKFYYDSNDIAKEMGVTTNEIISQAAAWSRLGFSSKESATEMAKLSSQFSSISPGLEIDDATNGLVSVMKAFDKDVDDVKDGIMSKINIVGNNFATSNAEIIAGLGKSSAAMAAMGGSLEDTIALFTAGQEILQDENSMGTALRSISMRIRGYDEETEALSEDLVNIKGDVVDLTKVESNNNQGISLFTDESQTKYKSIVQYLGEISDIYDEMSEKNRQELLEKLFGKTRAQAGSAILSNYEQVRAVLELMENSAGSADREMSVIEQSLEYKINKLKETWVGFAQDTASRETLGGIVDALTSLSNIVTTLLGGGLPELIGLLSGFAMNKMGIGELLRTMRAKIS